MNKKIASFVSNYLLNPGVLALVILVMAVLRSRMPENTLICWLLAILVLNTAIPGLFYLFFTSHGFVFDATLQNKKVNRERLAILGIFLALITLELLILVSTGAYQPLLAVFAGGILTIVIGGAITYFWKISIHATLTTFFVAMIILLYGWNFWPVIFLIPLVFWSRIILNRHTFLQLLFGCILSLAIVLVTFNVFGLLSLGWLG
ncbi:MAG: hypothetical protein M1338_03890 [Patescibacteria group bacterium]|nr:hypothetical protein [Patescibacteria group bacterium]